MVGRHERDSDRVLRRPRVNRNSTGGANHESARSGQGSETLTNLYPDGERESSSTNRAFAPGDGLERNRRSGVVVRIDDGSGRKESTVIVMPGDGGNASEPV